MARRGQNEGSIRKRRDGRYEARITLGWRDGKAQRKSFYGRTRGDVQRKLAKALQDREQGLPVTDDRLTVGTFLTDWLETMVKPTVRPSTHASYEGHVRLHIVPELGRIRLSQLAPRDVQRLINQKLDEGLSPRTVERIRATLRAALSHAQRWDLVQRNVAGLTLPPRVPSVEIEPYNPEEARAFLDAVKGHRLEALFTVALALGLRRGEALGLRWGDVDLEERQLTVCHALQRVEGALQLVEPKSVSSRRTIALPAFAVVTLREHRVRQVEERMLTGSSWQESGFVFTTTKGMPLDPANVSNRFKAVVKDAGLREVRFHDLRHACASLLLAQGVHPRVVMEMLGHSQIALTMNTYSHVIPALQKDAADRMDAVFSKGV